MVASALFHAKGAAGDGLFHLGWAGFLLLLVVLGGMLGIGGLVLVGMFGVS